ncbi:MAG: response regulator, partial [Desulfovibrio sp.]|nr:response regulator [Desulfovibrio sp.]
GPEASPRNGGQPGGPFAAPVAGRLLLVDDDHAALQAMARALGEAGFQVTAASGGAEALAAFELAGGDFGLVLADHFMPDMDGLELASRLLAMAPSTRIVMCTGHVEPALERRAIAAGVVDFLMKPMTPRTLLECVRRHCR